MPPRGSLKRHQLNGVIEPRITAAAFGAVFVYEALTEAARQTTIPIEFLLPWDDGEANRESGLASFDACASKERALHAYPGRHNQVPRLEVDNSARGPAPGVVVSRGCSGGVSSTGWCRVHALVRVRSVVRGSRLGTGSIGARFSPRWRAFRARSDARLD